MLAGIPRITFVRTFLMSWALLGVACLGCTGGGPGNQYQPPPPPEVTVAQPLQQSVTIFLEETGETEAVNEAEVRARVKGFLQEINFIPGQQVKKDDVLYVIEKDEYQAAVNSAQATIATAQAAVETAKAQVSIADVEVERSELEFQRVKELKERDVATQSDYDMALAARDGALASKESAVANVDAAQAELRRAEANLEKAQLELKYTEVKAPIEGKITKTEIKLGNLIEPGSLMATVVNTNEVFVNFSLSDLKALQLQQARLNGDRGSAEPKEQGERPEYLDRKAYLKRQIDDTFRFEGSLNYVDEKGIDPQTGTLGVRAIFQNPRQVIFPGLFVYVRVPIDKLDNALLLPEAAIQRDQLGSYVLTVNDEQKIVRTPVQTGQKFETYVLIQSDLSPDAEIVISGTQRLRPDMKVIPKAGEKLTPVKIMGSEDSPDAAAEIEK